MPPEHVVTRIAQRAAAALATSALALSLVVGAATPSALAAPLDAPAGVDLVGAAMEFKTYPSGALVSTPIVVRNNGTQIARNVQVKLTPIGFDNATIDMKTSGWSCRPYSDPADGFFGSMICTTPILYPDQAMSFGFNGKKNGAKAILAGEVDPRNTLSETNENNNAFRTEV